MHTNLYVALVKQRVFALYMWLHVVTSTWKTGSKLSKHMNAFYEVLDVKQCNLFIFYLQLQSASDSMLKGDGYR